MTPQPPAFRLDLRLRNNRLIRARERLGHMSAAAAAKVLALSYATLVRYEAFSLSPLTTAGEWKDSALLIAAAFYADPEDLWPKEALSVARARASLELRAAQIAPLMGGNPERHMMLLESGRELHEAFATLEKRERNVVAWLVLDKKSRAEVAQQIARCPQTVTQIADKALGKLRKGVTR